MTGPTRAPVARALVTRTLMARALVAIGVAALALVVAAGGVRDTAAYFTDTATTATTAGIFGGYLDPPTGVVCSTSGGPYVRWTRATGHVPNTGWRVSYTNTTNGVTSTDDTVPAATTQWRPPTSILPTTYTVVVASTRGAWISANSSPAVSIRYSVLGGYTCP